jgi:hypothetical protein
VSLSIVTIGLTLRGACDVDGIALLEDRLEDLGCDVETAW